MKKLLALGLMGLMSVAMVGCSSDDDDGLAGEINGSRCEDRPGEEADYLGAGCGAGDEGRYTFYSHNVNGINTIQCVDETTLPQSTEEFDEEYVNNQVVVGSTLARDGEYIKGDDCASGKVKVTENDDGDDATEETEETRTYVWRQQ